MRNQWSSNMNASIGCQLSQWGRGGRELGGQAIQVKSETETGIYLGVVPGVWSHLHNALAATNKCRSNMEE